MNYTFLKIGIFTVWIASTRLVAQTTGSTSLFNCFEKAVEAYPSRTDKDLLMQIADLKLKNLSTNYYPQLGINGQATYQSDVTSISLPPMLGISVPGSPHDQYKITLDAQQMVYDGGLTRNLKKLEKASVDADVQQVETDLLRVKEMVANTYYALLNLQSNKRLLQNTLQVLNEKKQTVASMVKNGVLLVSDVNTLSAEILKLEQTINELEISYSASIRMLNILTNQQFSDSVLLSIPEIEVTDSSFDTRPELKSFDLQQKKLEAAGNLSNAALLPKLYVFGQFGYGKPGLNMLSTEFDTYYIVGASLKWNFWDWNKSKREKQTYLIQKQMVSSKQANFEKNLNIDLQNKLASIQKLEAGLSRDAEILELRKGITKVAQSQLNNGVITSTDFVNELNSETQAGLNFETHKIQLLQAKTNYLIALGKY